MAVRALKHFGADIYYYSRTKKQWFEKEDIKYLSLYDKLIFTKADKEKKFAEIIDNKIDTMIEDKPENISELSNILPVICYNAEYNKECEGKNITRCYSWYDIYNKITDMKIEG